jgi:hypothetical protein
VLGLMSNKRMVMCRKRRKSPPATLYTETHQANDVEIEAPVQRRQHIRHPMVAFDR